MRLNRGKKVPNLPLKTHGGDRILLLSSAFRLEFPRFLGLQATTTEPEAMLGQGGNSPHPPEGTKRDRLGCWGRL